MCCVVVCTCVVYVRVRVRFARVASCRFNVSSMEAKSFGWMYVDWMPSASSCVVRVTASRAALIVSGSLPLRIVTDVGKIVSVTV